MGDIEQDRLAGEAVGIPVQPAGAVENDLGQPDHAPAQGVEMAAGCLGVNLSLLSIQFELRFANFTDWPVHFLLPSG